MARQSYFAYFASILAVALCFVPAQAATTHDGAKTGMSLQSLVLEAQGHSVNIVGP